MRGRRKLEIMNDVLKSNLHPKNDHRTRYDFDLLCQGTPGLKQFVRLNDYGEESIDFAHPQAVKCLNRALLKTYYRIDFWDIPEGHLCPPIPGRADYIHYVADLFEGKKNLKGLDIGVGANCIYPLLGQAIYDWSFVGADIEKKSLESAQKIIQQNHLEGKIELRLQANKDHIFTNIIKNDEFFDFSICNPPFHSSLAEASEGSQRKWKNLGKGKTQKPVLNFGGQGAELWCEGGELSFVRRMIRESQAFSHQVQWFTTLVSKKENLEGIYQELRRIKVVNVKTIEMGQGQKKSRMVAWSYGDKK